MTSLLKLKMLQIVTGLKIKIIVNNNSPTTTYDYLFIKQGQLTNIIKKNGKLIKESIETNIPLNEFNINQLRVNNIEYNLNNNQLEVYNKLGFSFHGLEITANIENEVAYHLGHINGDTLIFFLDNINSLAQLMG